MTSSANEYRRTLKDPPGYGRTQTDTTGLEVEYIYERS